MQDGSTNHQNGFTLFSGGPLRKPASDEQMAAVIRKSAGERSFREISEATGFNRESVRRWINAESRIPADFVASFCIAFAIPLEAIMYDNSAETDPSRVDDTNDLARSAAVALQPAIAAWLASIKGPETGTTKS